MAEGEILSLVVLLICVKYFEKTSNKNFLRPSAAYLMFSHLSIQLNLILHVRRVIQVQIDTSRYGVKCPDLIGDAGGQYMFFLYLFYRLRLSKVSQSVSNKSNLI